ncbi:MAG TPA: ABC transporter substrate-binding protein [Propioniciclava sp.]|uniref:ABC transporter substrate-binding protein n=1 Tax=Propioniciclava sp. TaxID=2038686 RepID=UPI002C02D2A9|nr:ABC transporter substrate-binding protein [Propioniciclava sp.]HRL79623.1 ABC transporter substrate-binding protein [Propioniciclava sp.]
MRRVLTGAIAAVAVLGLAACSSGAGSTPTATTSANTQNAALISAAKDAATKIAGGQTIGGKVTLLGALGGDQLDQYLAAFKPFEEATGIKVEYEGTRDMLSVLQTRVQGGNPPDVVSNPSLGQMRQLIKDGKLLALNDVVDVEQVKKDYDSGLVELGSQNGTLYGLMQTSALKGMVYYNPEKYQGPTNAADWNALNTWATQQADAGNTPWCLGVENGAASGWMSTDWIEQFVLTTYGTEVWDSWANGELSWNSPEIRAAFEAFGKIATDTKMVNGGPRAVVSTDFIKGSLPLWADPPRCSLTLQADWLGATVTTQVPGTVEGKSVDFFMFPAVNSANSGTIETSGEMLGAFNDTPQVRALMAYAATEQSQALIATTGSWLSANKSVSLDVYPTDARRKAAQVISEAKAVRFDASDLMPSSVTQAFWSGTLTYITSPDKLDEVLGTIEAARLAAR